MNSNETSVDTDSSHENVNIEDSNNNNKFVADLNIVSAADKKKSHITRTKCHSDSGYQAIAR